MLKEENVKNIVTVNKIVDIGIKDVIVKMGVKL